jgi:hypothetical protein
LHRSSLQSVLLNNCVLMFLHSFLWVDTHESQIRNFLGKQGFCWLLILRDYHGLPVDFRGLLTNRSVELNLPYILQFLSSKTVKNWVFYIPTKFWPKRSIIDDTVALLVGRVAQFG